MGRRLPTPTRRPRLQLALLLAGPVGWLVIAYLGSLVVLFVAAFWRLDPFTAEIVKDIGFQNFETLSRATSTARSPSGRSSSRRW